MAYSTTTDSGFFVESDEPRFSRMTAKDAAKMLARNRQEMIANELSRLAGDEYLEDIMQHMRQMEVSLLVHSLSGNPVRLAIDSDHLVVVDASQ